MTSDASLEKLALVNAAPGPRGTWRSSDARSVVAANTFNAEAGVSETFLNFWFRGFVFEASGAPVGVALDE